MLKVDNFTFKGDQIELLTYKSDSSVDSESDIEFISLDDFEQWCIEKYGCAYINKWSNKPFDDGCVEPHYVGFIVWWNFCGIDKNKTLETYINRPELPIIGAQDEEIIN